MMHAAAIAKLLGGPKVLHRKVETMPDLIETVREGLPVASLDAVSKRAGLATNEEKCRVLHIPARTLTRRQASGGRLDAAESERVVRLARLTQQAEDVLEDVEKAQAWLRAPNRALGGGTPLELLDTDLGLRLVEDVLDRIEYVVYG